MSYRVLAATALCLAVSGAFAQDEVRVSGQVEKHFVYGTLADEYRLADRYTRSLIDVEKGPWSLRAAYWSYPFCDFHEVDDTKLSYQGNGWSATIGRFRLPASPSNWYDQWTTGFNMLPMIEMGAMAGRQPYMRTIVGIKAEGQSGPHGWSVSLTDAAQLQDRLLPEKLDRASLRYTYFDGSTVYGVYGLFDTEDFGAEEQILGADFRWTAPGWTVRGHGLTHTSDIDKTRGYYVEAVHRPQGWSHVSLVGRWDEYWNEAVGASTKLESWLVGAKARLPDEWFVGLNYRGGPDRADLPLLGGWSIDLGKTFRF